MVWTVSDYSLEYKMLVSSANDTYLKLFEAFTMSFIYKLKRIGPKIDPCDTPQTILFSCNFILPKETNCDWLER